MAVPWRCCGTCSGGRRQGKLAKVCRSGTVSINPGVLELDTFTTLEFDMLTTLFECGAVSEQHHRARKGFGPRGGNCRARNTPLCNSDCWAASGRKNRLQRLCYKCWGGTLINQRSSGPGRRQLTSNDRCNESGCSCQLPKVSMYSLASLRS